ncbi:MAG: hypothetical protein HY235_30800 [Acidobacteria bacterium]|nr:hypothetical protein [Acidobacteriota bacterium]
MKPDAPGVPLQSARRLFYYKTPPGREQPVLHMREVEIRLLDVEARKDLTDRFPLSLYSGASITADKKHSTTPAATGPLAAAFICTPSDPRSRTRRFSARA